jgi:membrane protein YqaA with SNARE-associated domain
MTGGWLGEFFLAHGPAGLFGCSFLAATLLPIGSEWLLAALILAGADPWPLVAVAGAGNYLGACTTYAVGRAGSEAVTRRWLRIDQRSEVRAARIFRRFGAPALLLSWLPLVGDALCLAGGIFRVGFVRFSLYVAAGKLLRYAVVALAVSR